MANDLNIFKVLKACDNNDLEWFSKLTDEEKAGYVPFVAQRWLSGTSNDDNYLHHFHLIAVNDRANMHHNLTTKIPELHAALLASSGVGFDISHQWIKGPTLKRKSSAMHQMLETYLDRSLNDQEVEILKRSTVDDIKQMLYDHGVDDKEVKEIAKQWSKFIA